jgi:hypothetical protein
MRGLAENIWNVFAPAATPRSTAVQHPPAVPTCTPIRFFTESAMPQAYRTFSIAFFAGALMLRFVSVTCDNDGSIIDEVIYIINICNC